MRGGGCPTTLLPVLCRQGHLGCCLCHMLLALACMQKVQVDGARVLEGLAASGLRAIRYALEVRIKGLQAYPTPVLGICQRQHSLCVTRGHVSMAGHMHSALAAPSSTWFFNIG